MDPDGRPIAPAHRQPNRHLIATPPSLLNRPRSTHRCQGDPLATPHPSPRRVRPGARVGGISLSTCVLPFLCALTDDGHESGSAGHVSWRGETACIPAGDAVGGGGHAAVAGGACRVTEGRGAAAEGPTDISSCRASDAGGRHLPGSPQPSPQPERPRPSSPAEAGTVNTAAVARARAASTPPRTPPRPTTRAASPAPEEPEWRTPPRQRADTPPPLHGEEGVVKRTPPRPPLVSGGCVVLPPSRKSRVELPPLRSVRGARLPGAVVVASPAGNLLTPGGGEARVARVARVVAATPPSRESEATPPPRQSTVGCKPAAPSSASSGSSWTPATLALQVALCTSHDSAVHSPRARLAVVLTSLHVHSWQVEQRRQYFRGRYEALKMKLAPSTTPGGGASRHQVAPSPPSPPNYLANM